ncbi:MAG: PQQ-dependent sugar dehydrogenase, partial [Acidobacteria bacterium]|nr:PQQ-dependent sugar dehydrogenase [Acidobacteriota bacterium]
MAAVADPTDRSVFFVAEQGGLIRVVRDGALLDEPFLDLRNDISIGGERGLLGLALSPDYAQSRRAYVNFTNRNGDTVVARFVRDANNRLIATRASR